MANTVKNGDKVRVHYTGKFEDGEVFDSSIGIEPLEFEVGAGDVIDGFDEAVVGMAVGESKTVTITPDKGYGDYNPEMLVDMPRECFPDDITPEIGMQLEVIDEEDNPVPVTVVEVGDSLVRLDGNMPLAGKNLVFEIEVVEIQ